MFELFPNFSRLFNIELVSRKFSQAMIMKEIKNFVLIFAMLVSAKAVSRCGEAKREQQSSVQ